MKTKKKQNAPSDFRSKTSCHARGAEINLLGLLIITLAYWDERLYLLSVEGISVAFDPANVCHFASTLPNKTKAVTGRKKWLYQISLRIS